MRFSISDRFLPWLGAALLSVEVCVAGLSLFHSRVGPFYRDYYITEARSCWLWDDTAVRADADLRENHIVVGTLTPLDACFLLDGGWSSVENWGVWSDARFVTIELPAVPGKHVLALKVIGFSPRNRQSVRMSLNGKVIGGFQFVPSGMPSMLYVAVPPDLKGDIRLQFEIKHPHVPKGADQRQIGLGLIALDWRKEEVLFTKEPLPSNRSLN